MVTRERCDGAKLSVARVGVEEPEMSVSWGVICGEISSIKLKSILRDPPHQRQIALHRNQWAVGPLLLYRALQSPSDTFQPNIRTRDGSLRHRFVVINCLPHSDRFGAWVLTIISLAVLQVALYYSTKYQLYDIMLWGMGGSLVWKLKSLEQLTQFNVMWSLFCWTIPTETTHPITCPCVTLLGRQWRGKN